jgi:hypothetical protein
MSRLLRNGNDCSINGAWHSLTWRSPEEVKVGTDFAHAKYDMNSVIEDKMHSEHREIIFRTFRGVYSFWEVLVKIDVAVACRNVEHWAQRNFPVWYVNLNTKKRDKNTAKELRSN